MSWRGWLSAVTDDELRPYVMVEAPGESGWWVCVGCGGMALVWEPPAGAGEALCEDCVESLAEHLDVDEGEWDVFESALRARVDRLSPVRAVPCEER